jgi:hypothetical protein
MGAGFDADAAIWIEEALIFLFISMPSVEFSQRGLEEANGGYRLRWICRASNCFHVWDQNLVELATVFMLVRRI